MVFTTLEELGALKAPQLDELIKVYVEKFKVAAPEKTVKSNEAKKAFITNLVLSIGIPHAVTQEDLDANEGALEKAGVKVGDYVALPLPTTPPDDQNGTEGKVNHEDDKDTKEDDEDAENGNSGASDDLDDDAILDAIIAEGKLVYEGQRITKIRNRVANGRLFKELECATSCFTVPVDEFTKLFNSLK